MAKDLDYAPLSEGVQKKVEAALQTVSFHGQAIAQAREHHQAFELMIAVGAPAQDAQREIDLGGSLIGQDG